MIIDLSVGQGVAFVADFIFEQVPHIFLLAIAVHYQSCFETYWNFESDTSISYIQFAGYMKQDSSLEGVTGLMASSCLPSADQIYSVSIHKQNQLVKNSPLLGKPSGTGDEIRRIVGQQSCALSKTILENRIGVTR